MKCEGNSFTDCIDMKESQIVKLLMRQISNQTAHMHTKFHPNWMMNGLKYRAKTFSKWRLSAIESKFAILVKQHVSAYAFVSPLQISR